MLVLSALLALNQSATLSGDIHLSRGGVASGAVVYLEGSVRSKPMAKAVVDQRERRFIPHISVVTVGTKIQFPNHDTVFHNVFAEFDAKRFDLGMYARGETKTVHFDKPGLVALLCSVHSEMSAYVMVVDTPFFAVANDHGHFQLPGVPNGTYTLKVWQESGETESKRIEITESQVIQISTERR